MWQTVQYCTSYVAHYIQIYEKTILTILYQRETRMSVKLGLSHEGKGAL